MGGGPEHDDAALSFVEAASGGDVVILRASGSLASYPLYFGTTLAPPIAPRSVVTVLTSPAREANDPAVLCWVQRAEAIWLAGGDQWNYLGEWPAEVHDALAASTLKGAAIGGTSAGAVSLGEAAFDARSGTVTSQEALADPLRTEVSVSYPSFSQPELTGALVDSHFSRRDREGRLLVFLARFLMERGRSSVTGLGLDEGVAVVIEGGRYRVFAPDGQAAWIYEVSGPAALDSGRPLELEGVRRVRLSHGHEGDWPFNFDAASTDVLEVVSGVVRRP